MSTISAPFSLKGNRRSQRATECSSREAGNTIGPVWNWKDCISGTVKWYALPRMETPLTPLEFARRARKLHGRREAVVDGDVRLTYAQFARRCERWSVALAKLGVVKGDRVATIAPNTHQHLEQFYAIPQLGAVIVPINYRLSAEDFVYVAAHSGASVLCVHADFLDSVDTVRKRMPQVRHFVALEGAKSGWSS